MTLPKFQEPDWSQLPPEAVAWAVDSDGYAWSYRRKPDQGEAYWTDGACLALDEEFDMTGIDWRTTLRLRPTVAENATVEANPTLKGHEIAEALKVISAGAEDCAEQRNYELERLAEEAWKALLANLTCAGMTNTGIALFAFGAAEAFIAEREKRRVQCP